MQDQDLNFLLENVISAKKMAKYLHVSEELCEEVKNILNQSILLIRCYELYLAEKRLEFNY